MHFIKDQITLHTGVLYVTNERPISFCSISPSNEHCPEAIWAHLDPILKYIKAGYPNVSVLHFFSDGPTTQYRQKKNFFLFSKNIYEYGFESGTLSFFESAHGKGAADGIGGAIKRKLDAKIAQGIDIPNAETAFNILNMSDTEIKIFFIPMDNIKPLDISILPIPGTMKIHQLMTNSVLKVKYRNLSCFRNDLNGMCECYSPMIHEFKTATGQDTSKTQTKGKKRKTSEKENVDYREKTKRTRKYRKVSSSSENSTDMDIEYADSDVTCYMEEDTLDEDNLDNVDVDFIERKEDNEEQANTFDLDEKTGFLKQRIDPNKKSMFCLRE
ncbi:hypothetical protein PYW08_006157 [Mythimna loreyi]|uniref:Uncharacterized protein n=1 Tax=Mythimna loreyi TaxID=667449 RepID=A0ACC2QMU7_9NEOP|nr:hypothetical protein PYW08_006157 [Mythimna loreyi]